MEKLETTRLGNCTFVISKLCLVSILSHKSNIFSLWKPPVTGIPISLYVWDSRYQSFYIDAETLTNIMPFQGFNPGKNTAALCIYPQTPVEINHQVMGNKLANSRLESKLSASVKSGSRQRNKSLDTGYDSLLA